MAIHFVVSVAVVAVLWIPNDFFRIRIQLRILLFSWFRIRILFRILHDFFSYILNTNFTFIFPSCKCVTVRCIVWRDISFLGIFYKMEFLFLNWVFCWEIGKFISFSEYFYFEFVSDPELPGSRSGMIFPNPYPDPDPAKSFGSDRIWFWIHNTTVWYVQ